MTVKDMEEPIQVGANKYKMVLGGKGDVATAKPLFFPDGFFNGKKIAQGSAYVNIKTFDITLYDEETNTWGKEE